MPEIINQPRVGGGDIIKILPGTKENTMPSVLTGGINAETVVVSVAQLYGDQEVIPYRVRAYKQEQGVLGDRPIIDGALRVTYTDEWLGVHERMEEFQNDEAGCFWFVWYVKSRNLTYAVRLTIADFPPSPEGETGELDGEGLVDYTITGKGETLVKQGNVFETVTPE